MIGLQKIPNIHVSYNQLPIADRNHTNNDQPSEGSTASENDEDDRMDRNA